MNGDILTLNLPMMADDGKEYRYFYCDEWRLETSDNSPDLYFVSYVDGKKAVCIKDMNVLGAAPSDGTFNSDDIYYIGCEDRLKRIEKNLITIINSSSEDLLVDELLEYIKSLK